jgi:hypothetical protein
MRISFAVYILWHAVTPLDFTRIDGNRYIKLSVKLIEYKLVVVVSI